MWRMCESRLSKTSKNFPQVIYEHNAQQEQLSKATLRETPHVQVANCININPSTMAPTVKTHNPSTSASVHHSISRSGEVSYVKLETSASHTELSEACDGFENKSNPGTQHGGLISEEPLQIQCGENTALLYVSKLCQGSKGPCILFQNEWLTPNELQYISGRETAKDWKRSIRYKGKSLKSLIARGLVQVHPPICDCLGCRISSPVVSFTLHFSNISIRQHRVKLFRVIALSAG